MHAIAIDPIQSAKDAGLRYVSGTKPGIRRIRCAALREFEPFGSEIQAKKNIIEAINSVASRLGNTRAVCRKCYVHPAVLDCYLTGAMPEVFSRNGPEKSALDHDESQLLRLLQQRPDPPPK